MTNLELIFSMLAMLAMLAILGEEVTRGLAEDSKATGFEDNREVAVKGGKAAGEARKRLEKVTGKKVVSENSYKTLKDGDPKALL